MNRSFSGLVNEGLERQGLTLRELCRQVDLDPSFFSKVLSGKRSPPSSEDVLRRVAAAVGVDPAVLVVAAGRIPEEWEAIRRDERVFRSVHHLATSRPRPEPKAPAESYVRPELSEELL